ncbi:MAG: PAS domain S-box protein [Calditrichaeota bacterium]|nr:PAS domain S-box protein [Calditrichota bacterium]
MKKPVAEVGLKDRMSDMQRSGVGDPTGFWIFDARGRTVYVCESIARQLGGSPEEMQGASVFDFLSGKDAESLQDFLQEGKGAFSRRMMRLKGRKGETCFCSVEVVALDTVPVIYLATCGVSDSSRQRSMSATKDGPLATAVGEPFFHYLLQFLSEQLGADVAFVARFMDPQQKQLQTRMLYRNGYPVDNVSYAVQGTWCERVLKEGTCLARRQVERKLPAPLQNGRPPFRCYVGQVLTASDGQPLGVLALLFQKKGIDGARIRQILQTWAPRVSAELQREQDAPQNPSLFQRTRLLLDNVSDGFILVDDQGCILEVNPTFCNITGYAAGDLLGQSLKILQIPFWKEFRKFVADRVAGKTLTFELPFKRKDGQTGYLDVRFVTLSAADPFLVAIYVRDVSSIRAMIKELRASEEKFRSIVEHSHSGVTLVDDQFRFIYVNDEFCRMVGYSREELIGADFRRLLDKKDLEATVERYKKRQRGEDVPSRYELDVVCKDGTIKRLEVRANTFRDARGRVRSVAQLMDVSQRRKTEDALKRKDDILEAVNYAATKFIQGKNWDTYIQEIMERLGKASRASRVYIFKNSRSEDGQLLASQLYEWVAEGIEPQIDNPDLQDFPYVQNGFGRWVEELGQGRLIFGKVRDFPEPEREVLQAQQIQFILVAPIFVGNEWWGFIGFDNCRDEIEWSSHEIEALKTAANLLGITMLRLQAEQERTLLAHALRSIREAVTITDLNDTIIFVNEAFCKIYGYTREEVIGKPIHIIRSPNNDPEKVRQILPQTLAGGWQGELLNRRKNGEEFPIFLSTSVIYDRESQPIALIGVASDITERKQLEAQLFQAQKMEAVGRLAGGVAHDFNNILTIINGYSELLLSQIPQDSPMYKPVQQILMASEKASELTSQLLAFSRRQIVQPRVVNLNEIIRDLTNMLRRLIGEDVDLIIHLDPEAGNVKIDPNQVEQVLMNLVVNARDAMPNGGKLIIETANVELDDHYIEKHMGARQGRYVMLAVTDTGVGMDRETQQHIFEPFFTTKEKGKGTGLGLATVYGIIKQNNGFIWVYSEPGKGSTFKIYLPRVEEKAIPSTSSGNRLTADSLQGTETIMVVEDDEAVRKLIRSVLSERGYRLIEARQGREALEIARNLQEPIHLLLTDVVMPEMSGGELAQQIRRYFPDVKVLYISGYTDNMVLREGRLNPGEHFIQKPFSPILLLETIRKMLQPDR